MGWIDKSLSFPMSGVVRRASYREQSRPYSAPWAYNVRGTGSVELRRRGGSRPGMVSVFEDEVENTVKLIPLSIVNGDDRTFLLAFIDADGNISIGNPGENEISIVEAFLITDTGTEIVTDDNLNIVFNASTDATAAVERGGKLFLAGASLQQYDPETGVIETIAPSLGDVPANCPVICLYRDRMFLSGVNHLWYASRQSDFTDWHFSADMNDDGRALAGHLALAGGIGDKITAMIPIGDSRMFIATQDEIWKLDGDPVTGTLSRVSSDVGILTHTAWAKSPDDVVAFLSKNGVFTLSPSGSVDAWSSDRAPDQLRSVDPDDFVISMGWDTEGRGYHLFMSPVDTDENGLHWWLDLGMKALWPVEFLHLGHNPVSVCEFRHPGVVATAAVVGRDGFVRVFDPAEDKDDGYTIVSQVIVGPLRLPSDDMTDAVLQQISGSISSDSSSALVHWRVVSGNSAEEAAASAEDALRTLQQGLLVSEYRTGSWGPGRNRSQRPRQRGPWTAICLYSEDQWAFESIAIRGLTAGRLRDGN